jgi:hypothetical protein
MTDGYIAGYLAGCSIICIECAVLPDFELTDGELSPIYTFDVEDTDVCDVCRRRIEDILNDTD